MPNRQQKHRELLADSDTFTTILLTIIVDHYGTEAFGWAPETLMMELEDDLNVKIPKVNMDKIVVGIDLVTSDDFYTRPSRFVQICNVLAGSELTNEFDPADTMECAWGMTEAMILAPPEGEDPFHEEIRYYIGSVLDNEGIREAPDLLRLGIRGTVSGEADYSDMNLEDPTMFSAEYAVHSDRVQEIKEMLEHDLKRMFQQLGDLPLENGDTKDLLKRVQGQLAS